MFLKIEIDISSANKMLSKLAEEQFPFTFAYTLTLTANDARQEIVRQLPQKFTLRTGWWKPYSYLGFNVNPAKKKYLVAKIYTRAYFMKWHEEGGIKKPIENRNIAIPTINIRKIKSQRITKSQRPPALLHRAVKPAFFLDTKSGPVLFRRVAKKQLKAQYTLAKMVKIPARLGMRETAEQILKSNLYKNFDKAFTEAIRTGH